MIKGYPLDDFIRDEVAITQIPDFIGDEGTHSENDLPEYLDKELCKVLAIRYGYADGGAMDWIQKNLFQPLLALFPDVEEAKREERERIIKELRNKVAIEYKKCIEEAEANPFPSETLNQEHKLIWCGHASALSDVLSELDAKP